MINDLPFVKFFPHDVQQWLDNGFFFNGDRRHEISYFSADFADRVPINATVVYTMMQLAYYMGCDPVYLIGVDHSYQILDDRIDRAGNVFTSTQDDVNHFHSDYFGKGLRWHNPRVDRMESAYHIAKAAYEADGRTILNATAGGALDVFPRCEFASIAS